jgi:hypothetical protein
MSEKKKRKPGGAGDGPRPRPWPKITLGKPGPDGYYGSGWGDEFLWPSERPQPPPKETRGFSEEEATADDGRGTEPGPTE